MGNRSQVGQFKSRETRSLREYFLRFSFILASLSRNCFEASSRRRKFVLLTPWRLKPSREKYELITRTRSSCKIVRTRVSPLQNLNCLLYGVKPVPVRTTVDGNLSNLNKHKSTSESAAKRTMHALLWLSRIEIKDQPVRNLEISLTWISESCWKPHLITKHAQ